MAHAKRVDANHKAMVAHIRRLPGATVLDLSAVGHGCGDILVGWKGKNYMIEIKDGDKPPSRRKLTKDQEYFHAQWSGQIAVIKNVDELWALLR